MPFCSFYRYWINWEYFIRKNNEFSTFLCQDKKKKLYPSCFDSFCIDINGYKSRTSCIHIAFEYYYTRVSEMFFLAWKKLYYTYIMSKKFMKFASINPIFLIKLKICASFAQAQPIFRKFIKSSPKHYNKFLFSENEKEKRYSERVRERLKKINNRWIYIKKNYW